ncbi:unnamed protein product [Laminaria digitata]
MFGRMPTLPIDIIMGLPQAELPDTALQYTRETVGTLQLAYELARQNLDERSAVREASNVDLRFQQFQSSDLVLVHQPHITQDDPNNKLLSPWRGPYQVRHRLFPVVCRVSKVDQSNETSVHLGRMKPYHQRSAFVDPYFEKINQMFLGT